MIIFCHLFCFFLSVFQFFSWARWKTWNIILIIGIFKLASLLKTLNTFQLALNLEFQFKFPILLHPYPTLCNLTQIQSLFRTSLSSQVTQSLIYFGILTPIPSTEAQSTAPPTVPLIQETYNSDSLKELQLAAIQAEIKHNLQGFKSLFFLKLYQVEIY